jgi:hypothetical protein
MDSPFILAGIIVVIVAIVGGIAATIVRTRSESSFSYPTMSKGKKAKAEAYEPYEPPGDMSSTDLSKLDALLGGSASTQTLTVPTHSEHEEEGVPDELELAEEHYEATGPVELIAPAPVAEPVHTAQAAPPLPSAENDAPPEIIDIPDRDIEPLPDLWGHLVATEDGPLNVQDRLDMVARLEMVGEKWCVDALNSAVHEEQDPQVNAAVRAALARIG